MFATLEEKLIVAALSALVVVVGILGYNHHERKIGATVCVQQDHSAEIAQAKKETVDANQTIEDLRAQLVSITAAVPAAVPMRLCNAAPRSLPSRSTARSTESVALPHSAIDSGVQAGTVAGADIGAGVQDITLGCMLLSAEGTQLWNLAVKESTPQ
jgi:hypothetical protein